MLQFVNFTGSGPDSDDKEKRRTVRAQAMRYYRRTQREEREATQLAGVPPRDLVRTKSTRRGKDKALSQESMSTINRNVPSNALNQTPTRQPSLRRTRSSARRKTHHERIETEVVNRAQLPSQRTLPIRQNDTNRVSGKHCSTDRPKPLIAPNENLGEFVPSAAVLNRMSDFCKTYVRWLQPDLDAETVDSILSTVWEQSQYPILVAACYLAGAAHLDAVQQTPPVADYAIYKAHVLEEAAMLMESPETATSNEAIGTLACLQSFEMSQCSREATTHLQGLRSIIDMQGGLEAISERNLANMVQTLDLLHSLIFDTRPLMAVSETSLGRPVSDEDHFMQFTAMLAAEQQSSSYSPALHSSALSDLYGRLGRLLKELRRSSSPLADEEATRSNDAGSPLRQLSFEQSNYIDPSMDPQTLSPVPVARALDCAFVVLYNLIVFRMPFRCWQNQQVMKRLYASVRCIEDETRTGLLYHWLWILASGASASQDASMIAYVQAQVVRTIYQLDDWEFRRVKEFLLRFIDLRQTLQRFERGVISPDPIITAASN